MYLLDDRFSTAVAFVEGFDAARDGDPLNGFQEWVCKRILGGNSPRHWAYVLASSHVPGMGDGQASIDRIPRESEAGLIEAMLDLLEEFADLPAGGDVISPE
ncbi:MULTISPECIES: hypothetical protein [unclassified Streptomyces]|uniref:hypothetical protein n=1 Tax=unclassified Streptomyces TaxID=2593676 RepID=UPI0020305B1A|nr:MULTISPECIES: hypothetical protein [unclassified Streptomyces]MCM1975253.1 hypothetical protein [Streptomyces sp. G1]